MDLKNLILERNSKEHIVGVARYIGDDKKLIKELMECYFSTELKVASRASWIAGYVATAYPGCLVPYVSKIVNGFDKDQFNDTLKRNSLRLLLELKISKRFHGKLMNKCFEYLESFDAPPAVKANAMSILDNLSKLYPEIKAELKLVIDSRFSIESPAFKSRARKISSPPAKEGKASKTTGVVVFW
ncbi:MAG TPA: hypothetical protein VK616_18535 [Flavitalea sp.]|nr:hypothetical protein [Flavitalea sp.]